MGEYEPDDSRKVTQNPGQAPGEPPRTGPREDQVPRKRDDSPQPDEPRPMKQPRNEAAQSQNQDGGGQNQRQSSTRGAKEQASRTSAPGNPDRQAMQSEPGGALAGNQPQAIDNPPGDARPHYDQYELNHPQNMHRQSADHAAKVREQAGQQADGGSPDRHPAEDDSERQAPAGSSRAPDGGSAGSDDDESPPDASQRGYGGRGEAAAERGEEG